MKNREIQCPIILRDYSFKRIEELPQGNASDCNSKILNEPFPKYRG